MADLKHSRDQSMRLTSLTSTEVTDHRGTTAVDKDLNLDLFECARVGLAVGTFAVTGSIGAASMIYAITGYGGPSNAPRNPRNIIDNVAVPSAEDIAKELKVEIKLEAIRGLQRRINTCTRNMDFYLSVLADAHKPTYLLNTLIPDIHECIEDAKLITPEGMGTYWIAVALEQTILREAAAPERGVLRQDGIAALTRAAVTDYDGGMRGCYNQLFKTCSPSPAYPLREMPFRREPSGEYSFTEPSGSTNTSRDRVSLERRFRATLGRAFRKVAILHQGTWDLDVAAGLPGELVKIQNESTGKYLRHGYGFYEFNDTGDVFQVFRTGNRVSLMDETRHYLVDTIPEVSRPASGSPDQSDASAYTLIGNGPNYHIQADDGRYWHELVDGAWGCLGLEATPSTRFSFHPVEARSWRCSMIVDATKEVLDAAS